MNCEDPRVIHSREFFFETRIPTTAKLGKEGGGGGGGGRRKTYICAPEDTFFLTCPDSGGIPPS